MGRPILSLPDARTDRKRLHTLPAAPRLSRDPSGRPVLSLVVLLGRTPEPGRDRLEPLVEGGQLNFDVDLGADAAELAWLAEHQRAEAVPLFARDVRYLLYAGPDDRAWAEATVGGTGARASLAARLGRDQALALLAILTGDELAGRADRRPGPSVAADAGADARSVDGEPAAAAGPRVRAVVGYRTAGQPSDVLLEGHWATLYDYLASSLEGSTWDRPALRRATEGMMAAGLLTATARVDGADELLPFDDLLFDTFLRSASIILEPDPLGGDRYRLRGRPHDAFPLTYGQRRLVSRTATLTLETPLADLLTGAVRDRPLDAHVRLVTLGASALGSRDVPRSVRAAARAERGPPDSAAKMGLIAQAGMLRATHDALLPKPRPSPVAEPVSLTRPLLLQSVDQRPSLTLHGDYVLELPDRQRPRSLPVVDGDAPLWPDRNDPRLRWYAPTFELVVPDPSTASDTSPFLFVYRRVGASNEGAPAIEARIRFTLRRGMSSAGRNAAAEATRRGMRVREVPLSELAASVQLPFVDAASGEATSDLFDADLEEDGDTVRVSLELRDEWARLCYGALAEEGFQASPLRLRVGYAFDAYVPVKGGDLSVDSGGKVRAVSVAYGGPETSGSVPSGPVLYAHALTLEQPGATVHWRRETLIPRREEGRPTAPTDQSPATAATATAERRAATTASAPASIAARPPLRLAAGLSALLAKVGYARRSVSRVEEIPAVLPCRRFGELYRELHGREATSTAIGCRDALKLGETVYRQYEELAEIATPDYRVYRSLQQPGHFLVLAARYHLTRLEEETEVRPGIMLYALLDPDDAGNVRVSLDATLQPALAPYVRRELLSRLAPYASRPRLLYPTEIGLAALQVNWGLDPGVDVSTVAAGPFLRASFATGAASWLLLRTRLEAAGLAGSATFTLPDGTNLVSSLELRLDTLAGPWDDGAVKVRIAGRTAELHDCTEAPADVHELVLYGPDARVPVEATLAPGERLSVPLDDTHTEAYAAFTVPRGDPVTITEVRSFIENLDQSVAFVSLIDLPGRGLQALDVEARLAGVDGAYRARITSAMPVAEVHMLLPLTAYLDDPTLQYRVTKLFTDDRAETTAWLEAALSESAIVDLSWERLA